MALKNLYVTPKLPTYFSIGIRYVRNNWVTPQKTLWNIFCALVRAGTIEQHCKQGKCSYFLPIWICRIQWVCSLFSISTANTIFWVNLVQNNQNCQSSFKFGTWTNSNMQKSMVGMFNFSAFYWNYPFWTNLVQLIKIVRLSWNLVPRIIRIRRI